MKILYVTTIGSTMYFFRDFIRRLIDEEHTVDIATNEKGSIVPSCYREWGCRIYSISCSRSPADWGNLAAIKQIRSVVQNGNYDIVHCHTPIAAMCTRLACKPLRQYGVKVIYTAHGFHFYKGAPLKNWLLYYPVERLCSYWTDVLITINREDCTLAKEKMRAKHVEYVSGTGINIEKFKNTQINRAAKRKELNIPEDALLLLSVGELNENKNHKTVIHAMAELQQTNIHYTIAGDGGLRNELSRLAQDLGIFDQIHFLGFRTDMAELYKAADALIHPSFREGLPVSVMEAMASGLPVIGSRIRGNMDLIVEGKGGYLVDPKDAGDFVKQILKMLESPEIMEQMGSYNRKFIRDFGIVPVMEQMRHIYQSLDEV